MFDVAPSGLGIAPGELWIVLARLGFFCGDFIGDPEPSGAGPFGLFSQPGPHLAIDTHSARTRSSVAVSAYVRQCAACCRRSLGVARQL